MIGALSANPLSVSFRKSGYNPKRPGFIGWLRHPIIWGLTLWALAHIPANGDSASLALFAGSAGFGALGTWATDRRLRRQISAQEWAALRPAAGHMDAAAWRGLALGLVAWLALLVAHPVLFGADPLAVLMALLA